MNARMAREYVSKSGWSSTDSKRARAVCAPLVAQGVPCYRCRKPILPGQAWHADHIVQRHSGGTDDASNLWPSHAKCNERDGGKVGVKITQAKLRAKRMQDNNETERDRGIRGV